MSNYRNKEVQVVSFASPYPPNYGGVMDVFYRLKALYNLGVKVHLHTYIYKDHKPHERLNELCASVEYYKRSNTHKYLQGWPYIASSRYNKNLIENVIRIGKPVILEGLHTCFMIEHLEKAGIPFVVRMHNIEWKYYKYLAELELSYPKKKYFLEEARRLKKFEDCIQHTTLLAISVKDEKYLKQTYPHSRTLYIPAFHHYTTPEIKEGKGNYAIFHGNLSVNENEQAAIWLMERVFSKLDVPLVITGKDPTDKVIKATNAYPNVKLIANPGIQEMRTIMEDAQIHLLPNQQPTGMKIKWVNALFSARFIIVNPEIYPESHPEIGIYALSGEDALIHKINELKNQFFTNDMSAERQSRVNERYDNLHNAELILSLL
ncbi:MAG: glycosyltransferase [Chitinophagales bacterium]|nr:glycosyltransferase [Chitinophagales bacterium]